MDKLKTDLYGGFPWELNDWRWEIEAHRNAMIGLCKGLQNADGSGIIISGMTASLNGAGGVLSISPGWMSWGGELFYYPGGPGNGAFGPELHFLKKDIRYDPATAETFEDGTVHNAYEIRRLSLVASGIDYWITVDAEDYASLGRMRRLRELLWPEVEEPITDFFADMTAPNGLRVRFDTGSMVRLNGTVHYDGFATGATGTRGMFRLPVRYRPNNSVYRSVAVYPFTDAPRNITIDTNGVVSVWVTQSGINPGTKLYLSDIRYNLR